MTQAKILFALALFLVAPVASYADEPLPQLEPTTLNQNEISLIEWVDKRQDEILEELRQHVNINTGTQNIEGLDHYRKILTVELETLGFSTREHESAPIDVLTCAGGQIEIANHLSATINGSAKNRLLLNGHIDTVFGPDDEFQTLEVDASGILKGPGVADMKGGIVIMLNALRALHAQGRLNNANMTVLLNTDEEIGSLGSRQLIENMAREHDLGLVFEGSSKNLVTRSRKGLGQVRLKVLGRESHAGAAHEDGVSASLELAHKIVAIEQLTNYDEQATVNVGVMAGGEKRNTIPGCAEAYIDLRFPHRDIGANLERSITEIAQRQFVNNPNYPEFPKTEIWSTLHRPVKPIDKTVDQLIAQAMSLSVLIGEPIVGSQYSGGGTDGSIAQGVGLPTFDSIGMDGAGAHSSREESTVASLIARTKLAAVMLNRLIDAEPF